ncbi:MAG: HAMP domain-containing sensor histidine kinase [Rhodospirillaceae bacterium]
MNTTLGVADGCVQVGRSLEASIRIAAEAGLYVTDTAGIDELIRRRMDWYTSRPDETISIIYPAAGGRFLKFTRSPVGTYGLVVVFVDVSEQIKNEITLKTACERAEKALEDLLGAQNRLVQSEKLASLGRLVAGVAHEINTPLGISITTASLFADWVESLAADFSAGRLRRSDMVSYIADVREGCTLLRMNLERAADLVKSFKQVAADQTSDSHRRFELSDLLSDIVISLGPVWRKAGHRVKIECPETIVLDGHPGVISQILTNLITNSVIHGFEPGQKGTLTVTAGLCAGEGVELTYSDNGKGIPGELRDKVFDPFFTTKRNSGSTGLGMYIIYNLITGKLGGNISLNSEPGYGVRFVMRFPRKFPVTNSQG